MASTSPYLMVFVVALGSFTFGFNNSVIGSVLGLKSFFDYFDIDQNGGGRADSIIGATSGLFAGGGALGSLALAPFAPTGQGW